jgi:hypothetical protein
VLDEAERIIDAEPVERVGRIERIVSRRMQTRIDFDNEANVAKHVHRCGEKSDHERRTRPL